MPTPPGRWSSISRYRPRGRRWRSNSRRSRGADCPQRASRVRCEQRRITAACGQEWDLRDVVIDVVDGCGRSCGVGLWSWFASVDFSGEGGIAPSGVVVVRDRLTKFSIRSGTSCGVTCSTTVKLGSRRTFVGCLPASAMWYSSGTGMFDADNLSRCEMLLSALALAGKEGWRWILSYSVARFQSSLLNGFHDAPFLVCHIPHPI